AEFGQGLEFRRVLFGPWAGSVGDGAAEPEWMDRLVEGCLRLCDHATAAGVRLAFEPEPGMAVDTMDRFAALFRRVGHPAFGLTRSEERRVGEGARAHSE